MQIPTTDVSYRTAHMLKDPVFRYMPDQLYIPHRSHISELTAMHCSPKTDRQLLHYF